jgi:hypothetical protein
MRLSEPLFWECSMFKFLTGGDRRDGATKIDRDSAERLQVGAVLLETCEFLPKQRFPRWRVIKRFRDRNDTTHVVIQNLREPTSCKALSLTGLVVSDKYALQAGYVH